MRRRLFTFLSAVSLLLCVVAIALMCRARYLAEDDLTLFEQHADYRVIKTVSSDGGRITYVSHRQDVGRRDVCFTRPLTFRYARRRPTAGQAEGKLKVTRGKLKVTRAFIAAEARQPRKPGKPDRPNSDMSNYHSRTGSTATLHGVATWTADGRDGGAALRHSLCAFA